jgi:hypothetical protein
MSEWNAVVEPQVVKRRCIGCNAQVVIETDGVIRRQKPHPADGHVFLGVPFCVASGAEVQ